ncbi:MAG: orotidine 5'-phosphate decarboxylase [Candidatus Aenigmarchaeota archaeon]|nr:orotidine 5'-phosphate decarboxylase [Candidatus Aenigmarchaeota archaeon]
MERVIEMERSVIPACDVPFDKFEEIVEATADVEKICAYKVGFTLGYLESLPKVTKLVRDKTDKIVIFDHQKAATDITFTAKQFMDVMEKAEVDAVILDPQSGPAVQYDWTKEAQSRNLGVIIVTEMTHPRYLDGDFRQLTNKKGELVRDYTKIFKEELGIDRDIPGYQRKGSVRDKIEIAARMGIQDYVMPGNKPDKIKLFKEWLAEFGVKDPGVYSPGLIRQGGNINEGAEAAGNRFHGIVGTAIYTAENIREAATGLTSQI